MEVVFGETLYGIGITDTACKRLTIFFGNRMFVVAFKLCKVYYYKKFDSKPDVVKFFGYINFNAGLENDRQ